MFKNFRFKIINKKIALIKLILFSLLSIIITCTTEEPPKGGPEDKKPPELIENKCNPKNGMTNFKDTRQFKSKKLIFVFNKEIKEITDKNQITIIPSITNDKVKLEFDSADLYGNTRLILKLNHKLDENTVYKIDFGNAIVSKNENVVANNLTVTFSTGPELASTQISGTLTNIMTEEPIGDAYISLFKENRGQNILNGIPDYYAKTNKQGLFKVEYIKKGNYYIYASNKIKLDSKNEKIDENLDFIGFTYKKIDENDDKIIIRAVKTNVGELKKETIEIKNKIYNISFNKPLKNYEIKILDTLNNFKSAPKFCSLLSDDRKSIEIYNFIYDDENEIKYMVEEYKGIKANIIATDFSNKTLSEEIKIHFGSDSEKSKEFDFKISPSNEYISPNSQIQIIANKPIKALDKTKIHLKNENGEIIYIPNSNILHNKYDNKVEIKIDLPSKTPKVTLTCQKEALVSIENEKSAEKLFSYSILSKENTGLIKGSQYLDLKNCIIQLLDNEFNIIQEVRNQIKYEFKDIPEGEYTIRILALSKGRKEWFAGNIEKIESPDPVFLYHPENGFIKIIPGMKRTLNTFYIKSQTKHD